MEVWREERKERMATEKKIDELVRLAIAAELDGVDELIDAPTWALARCYNGCGPEWMPSDLRDKLTRFLELFEPAFLGHDWDFSNSDGSEERFHAANLRLLCNCRKLADRKYGWWNWKRYRARAAAFALYEAVETFGWKAWTDARRAESLELGDKTTKGENDEETAR